MTFTSSARGRCVRGLFRWFAFGSVQALGVHCLQAARAALLGIEAREALIPQRICTEECISFVECSTAAGDAAVTTAGPRMTSSDLPSPTHLDCPHPPTSQRTIAITLHPNNHLRNSIYPADRNIQYRQTYDCGPHPTSIGPFRTVASRSAVTESTDF
ncbi:uncharacterized protein J3D65DRAFT_413641 [Phyllosticta citribraziliensis]|uniref:Secreted protein n=1 Tax=Phyllosticta citribraziliensis TaxID=989973 RepID=A0ABR1LMA6_9PEZI